MSFLRVLLIINAGTFLLSIPGVWATFQKAGIPGWQSAIPVLNWFRKADLAGRSRWIYGFRFLDAFVLLMVIVVGNVLGGFGVVEDVVDVEGISTGVQVLVFNDGGVITVAIGFMVGRIGSLVAAVLVGTGVGGSIQPRCGVRSRPGAGYSLVLRDPWLGQI